MTWLKRKMKKLEKLLIELIQVDMWKSPLMWAAPATELAWLFSFSLATEQQHNIASV